MLHFELEHAWNFGNFVYRVVKTMFVVLMAAAAAAASHAQDNWNWLKRFEYHWDKRNKQGVPQLRNNVSLEPVPRGGLCIDLNGQLLKNMAEGRTLCHPRLFKSNERLKNFSFSRFSRFQREPRCVEQITAETKDGGQEGPAEVGHQEPDDDVGQRRVHVRRHHDDDVGVGDGRIEKRRRDVVVGVTVVAAAVVAPGEICIQPVDATDGAEVPRQERERRKVRTKKFFFWNKNRKRSDRKERDFGKTISVEETKF